MTEPIQNTSQKISTIGSVDNSRENSESYSDGRNLIEDIRLKGQMLLEKLFKYSNIVMTIVMIYSTISPTYQK